MKGNAIRWLIAAILLVSLAMTMVSPAVAEVQPLALDQTVPGNVPLDSGWSYIADDVACKGKTVYTYAGATKTWSVSDIEMPLAGRDWARYEDDSISMVTEYFAVRPSKKPKVIPCVAIRVKIADPSQIRTAMTLDDYDKREYVKAIDMAKHKNAVCAANGDFFKYHYKTGYVVRQGVFYRDKLQARRDLLLIDNKGDFHTVKIATSENTAAYIQQMTDQGLSVVNTFTLGPVLVEDGQSVDIMQTITAKVDEFQYYSPQQRIAICQLGELEYLIIETFGESNGSMGMTLQEFADLIAFLYPECQVAYNLDGGGSTNAIVRNELVHKTSGARKISDILYFASAHVEDAQ